jgi:hypothetical protein
MNKAFEINEQKLLRIAADHELFLKFHRADPAPLGFVSCYAYGDSYTKGMSCTPSVDRPHPVYRAAPSRLTTLEWQNDSRTQELFALIRTQDAMLKAREVSLTDCRAVL